jgi:hypothetical protein
MKGDDCVAFRASQAAVHAAQKTPEEESFRLLRGVKRFVAFFVSRC